ncbi:MAG: hypothetical protein HY662_04315 [Chloroflexi bacterium]|nr:hypothetical protein [Chloroflexota bacterium]
MDWTILMGVGFLLLLLFLSVINPKWTRGKAPAMQRWRIEKRDELCSNLRANGVDARLAQRGRAEETWGPTGSEHVGIVETEDTNVNWPEFALHNNLDSVGLVEIEGSPIRWVNVLIRGVEEGQGFILEYGIPDLRNLPQLEIEGCPSGRSKVVWREKDHGTGITQFLSSDLVVENAILASKVFEDRSPPGITIRFHHERHCWLIMQERDYELPKVTREKWNCYEVIAHHLLAAPVQG